jgi:hypothetical protein
MKEKPNVAFIEGYQTTGSQRAKMNVVVQQEDNYIQLVSFFKVQWQSKNVQGVKVTIHTFTLNG